MNWENCDSRIKMMSVHLSVMFALETLFLFAQSLFLLSLFFLVEYFKNIYS